MRFSSPESYREHLLKGASLVKDKKIRERYIELLESLPLGHEPDTIYCTGANLAFEWKFLEIVVYENSFRYSYIWPNQFIERNFLFFSGSGFPKKLVNYIRENVTGETTPVATQEQP